MNPNICTLKVFIANEKQDQQHEELTRHRPMPHLKSDEVKMSKQNGIYATLVHVHIKHNFF